MASSNVLYLIKYNIGDTGKIVYEKCKCGVSGKKIRKLQGRIEDYILNRNKKKVFASYLRQFILSANEKCENAIIRAQFIQKKNLNLIDKLQLFKQNKELGDYIKHTLAKDLGIKVEIEVIRHLIQERGKFKLVIREK